jgi:hypothetical protein
MRYLIFFGLGRNSTSVAAGEFVADVTVETLLAANICRSETLAARANYRLGFLRNF